MKSKNHDLDWGVGRACVFFGTNSNKKHINQYFPKSILLVLKQHNLLVS